MPSVLTVKGTIIFCIIVVWMAFAPATQPTMHIYHISDDPMAVAVDQKNANDKNAGVAAPSSGASSPSFFPTGLGPVPKSLFTQDASIPKRIVGDDANALTEVSSDMKARSALSPAAVGPTNGRPNGVIMFLYGGTKGIDYFFDHTLPSLERNVLSCAHYKYPVRIFYEEIPEDIKATIRSKVPSASEVIFEDVSHLWKTLPHNISEEQVTGWMGKMKNARSRGYRFMCRFWAGMVWQLPSMQQYDYYWRLDTDSFIIEATVDPFVVMQQRQCEYGFNNYMNEDDMYTKDMFAAFEKWAVTSPHGPPKERLEAIRKLVTHYREPSQIIIPQFFNNFELGTVRIKTSVEFQSFFRYIDSVEPFGIFQHRWGDAPLHTLAIFSILGTANEDKICYFPREMIQYIHDWKVEKTPPVRGCHKKDNGGLLHSITAI